MNEMSLTTMYGDYAIAKENGYEKSFAQFKNDFGGGPIDYSQEEEIEVKEFANGGGVGSMMQPKRGLVNGPGGYAGSIENIINAAYPQGNFLDIRETSPTQKDYNINVTKETVQMAHKEGVSVEGELGCLGSLETGMGEKEDGVGAEGILSNEQLLTDPEEAADFVSRTQVDALAIAIGTSHGAYKFTRPPTGDILAIERIKAIHKRIPGTHLVMHGSSSVPQDLLKIINENGGAIKETYGVPVKEIQEGIKYGVRKVNIDTDLRLASTAAIRKHFANDPAQFDPRKYLIQTKEAMKKIVMSRLEEFGTAGNADKIKPLALYIIAKKYSSGELSAKIN